jgi:glycosyltransferase involved in cell wall biosynthesis
MEAMMSGLPVVASALSGVPELVEDQRTGFLVPPGDPWSLADRLRILARAPQLRRRMGSRGRRKVLAQFDQARGAQRLLREVDRRARASRSRDT